MAELSAASHLRQLSSGDTGKTVNPWNQSDKFGSILPLKWISINGMDKLLWNALFAQQSGVLSFNILAVTIEHIIRQKD
jgi:hypothetical protein